MINDNTMHGAYGKLQALDRAKISTMDGTVLEGIVTSFNHGGAYIGSYFVGWERVAMLTVLHRPTEEEKFEMEVTKLIQNMTYNLGGQRTVRSLLPIVHRVIEMVREHDAAHSDTKAEPSRVVWERERVPAPMGSSQTATPAHVDREEEERVPR
jgi:hypothetical protein